MSEDEFSASEGVDNHNLEPPPHPKQKSGKVAYCGRGHESHVFVPQRTCVFISQHALHYGEMTVRETLYFPVRCLGIATRCDLPTELSRREKEAGIEPDSQNQWLCQAKKLVWLQTMFLTFVLHFTLIHLFQLHTWLGTVVRSAMQRDISGSQKKRMTTVSQLALLQRPPQRYQSVCGGSATTN